MPPVQPPLSSRLPNLSSLENCQLDPRPLEFRHLLESDVSKAEEYLRKQEFQLSFNALEEYTQALKSRGGRAPSRLLDSERLPYTVQTPVRELELPGSVEDVLFHRESVLKKSWSAICDELGTDSKRSFEREYKFENSQRHGVLQCILPEQAWQLRDLWEESLKFYPLGGPFKVLNVIKERVPRVVAHHLARITIDMVSVTFPRSTSGVCREIAFGLEDELLAMTAQSEGLRYWYTGSEYLWGLLGLRKWSDRDRLILGSHYLKRALKNCKFESVHPETGEVLQRPAFWHTWYVDGVFKRGIIRINRELVNQLRHHQGEKINVTQVPPLVTPGPYASRTDLVGGIRCSPGLISSGNQSQEQSATIEKAIQEDIMQPVLKSMEVLSGTAWRINSKVLHIIVELLRNSIQVSDIPVKPSNLDSRENIEKSTTFRRYNDAIRIAELLSRNGQKFFERHYIDFRGRCYPYTGSTLTHMGSDSLRAIFEFCEGRPLGTKGLHWLKVNLANVYGTGKSLSFLRRVEWTDSQLHHIRESAHRPLETEWWRQAEKPFQTLRTCFEIDAALKVGSEKFVSHMPVTQDGSCNGLQHLTALARDERLAPSVNLVPNTEPGDVYSEIAISIGIPRNSIKKPIMTSFYGATSHAVSEILRSEFGSRATKVANNIRHRLENIGEGAWAIHRWLSDMAYRISHSARADNYTRDPELVGKAWYTAVSWTTPLGLPVVQPYSNPGLMAVRTALQTFYCKSPHHQAKSDTQKQKLSFPPNYVHSLDAAHMQLTALRAQQEKISFAAVHDSFWTHAGDMDKLRLLLRQAFVQLHENSQLERLLGEWKERYTGYWQLAFLHQSSPLYNKVRWLRNGKMGNPKILRQELDYEYTNQFKNTNLETPWTLIQEHTEELWYENGVPHLGKTGQMTRVWVPLIFDPLPKPRGLSIENVLESEYFFH